jgi:hypothetical protein
MYALYSRSRSSRRKRLLLRNLLESTEAQNANIDKAAKKVNSAHQKTSSQTVGRHEIRPVKPFPLPPEPPPLPDTIAASIAQPSVN